MASLSSEQRQRMEQNRLRALQLRAQKNCKQFMPTNSTNAAASKTFENFAKGASSGVQQSELRKNINKPISEVDHSSIAGQLKVSSNISKVSSAILSVSSASGPTNPSASHDSNTRIITSTPGTSFAPANPSHAVSFSSSKPVSQFYKKTLSTGSSSEVNSKNENLKGNPQFQKYNPSSDRPTYQHGGTVLGSRNISATSSNVHFHKQASNSISSKQSSSLMFGHKNSLCASCHLISKDRFMVEMPFQQNVVEIFQKMKSKSYDASSRKWTFGVLEYTDLIKQLRSLRPPVDVKPLPPPIVKLFCTSSKPFPVQEANLISVDQELRDNLLPFQRDGVKYGNFPIFL
ncbi:SWI/SNF-related matrix-associated actin-dependent regulator of chromatin subfamily A-like protein 1 [Holothuria leucospilota]|uniref:SWI/SNF-related matrix-associated actin-dependent regulator of chromatin subfamily A-like protein 1 n=1 Tax=Holothuria leucospilota TaxID=206669 RepID=A0A9Q0YCR0_HOLLE|nr:SWI/SNF-related matrix-associated actin-dependent regulator of chromatin subfamily A-like protein 1 [Holothuria leucospilota]